jgi:hypothetical protein
MTDKKQQPSLWLPLRVLDDNPSTEVSALIVPSFVCYCLFSQRTLPRKERNLVSGWRPNRVLRGRINERWASLMGALTIVAPDHSLKRRKADTKGIRKLFRWFIRSVRACGVDWIDERLKAMYNFSRHLSGKPVPESSKVRIPAGTPGFNRLGEFIGYSFFRHTCWSGLNGRHVETHWAFSMGKCAMGFPTHEKKVASLKKFKATTAELITPPKEVLIEAEAFAYAYTIGFPRGKIAYNMDIHISDSTSSCWEKSNGKGGRHSYFHELLVEFFRKEVFRISNPEDAFCPSGRKLLPLEMSEFYFEPTDQGVLVSGEVLALLWGNSRLLLELSFCMSLDDAEVPLGCLTDPAWSGRILPFHFYREKPEYVSLSEPSSIVSRMDAVDDKAAKARVIGVTKGHLINLGHLLRRATTAVLKCDRTIPTMGWPGKGPDRVLGPDPPFDSADITAATDSTDISEATALQKGVVRALIDLELLPEWFQDVAMTLVEVIMRPTRATAPAWWVDDKDGADVFPFVTQRSVPMGQPHSWNLLSLGQKFHRYRARPLVPLRHLKEIICGDDTAASGGDLETYKRFRSSLEQSGYKLSPGTDVISNLCIQYTERMFVFRESEQRKYLTEVKYPPVSSLLDKNPYSRLPQCRSANQHSAKSSRGPASTKATLWVSLPFSVKGYAQKVVKASRVLAMYSNHGIAGKAKNLDIPVYLPQEFGGLGFTHPDGKSLSHLRPFFMKGLASLLSDNRNLNYLLNFRSLGSSWFFNQDDQRSVDVKNLVDHWVTQVFDKKRQITCYGDLMLSMDSSIWERPCWVDITQFCEEALGAPLKKCDWESYDAVKGILKDLSGIGFFPIKEVLDSVEGHFRADQLFVGPDPGGAADESPSLALVSKRVHKFYKKLLNKQPPPPKWKDYSSKNIEELLDDLHWRQNLILVAGHLPLLEKFRSKW